MNMVKLSKSKEKRKRKKVSRREVESEKLLYVRKKTSKKMDGMFASRKKEKGKEGKGSLFKAGLLL